MVDGQLRVAMRDTKLYTLTVGHDAKFLPTQDDGTTARQHNGYQSVRCITSAGTHHDETERSLQTAIDDEPHAHTIK